MSTSEQRSASELSSADPRPWPPRSLQIKAMAARQLVVAIIAGLSPAAAFMAGPALPHPGLRSTAVLSQSLQMRGSDARETSLWLPGDDRAQDLWLPSPQVTRRDALRYSAGSALAAAAASPLAAGASQGRDLPSLAVKAPLGDSVKLSNGGGKFPLGFMSQSFGHVSGHMSAAPVCSLL